MSERSNKVVCLLSGGMDSTVMLANFVNDNVECEALAMDYGQRHSRELIAAERVADYYGVHLTIVEMALPCESLFAGSQSSQVGDRVDVPHGHYAAETMKLTIVPNRNMVLLALAGARAAAIGAGVVAYAAHAGDHAIYPDCRPEFAAAMGNALRFGNDPYILLERPFIHKSKTDICKLGGKLLVPFELTWSCYDPQPEDQFDLDASRHCGKCGTCVERIEAFRDAGVEDPTLYVSQVA